MARAGAGAGAGAGAEIALGGSAFIVFQISIARARTSAKSFVTPSYTTNQSVGSTICLSV